MRWLWVAALLALGGVANAAPPPVITNSVAVCDPNWPLRCLSMAPDGALSVTGTPAAQFFDAFNGSTLDATNWTANNSSGSDVVASGSLVISSSNVASAWGGVSSNRLFSPSGIAPQIYGVSVSFPNSTVANSTRVFGVFTAPGTPTIAVPATDGYLFRLDGTGQLFAEVWSNGAAVGSVNVTISCKLPDNVANVFGINYRTSLVTFYCGTTQAAQIPAVNPVNQQLPISGFSIAGATPPATSATMILASLSLASYTESALVPAGQVANVNDPAVVVALSPNSAGVTPGSSSAASAGITPVVSGSASSGVVLKNAPGNLYSVYATCTAACWLMVFNSTTVPADGATTAGIAAGNLQDCIPIAAGGIGTIAANGMPPEVFSTGISAAISSTACAIKTAAITGFIHGSAK